MSRLVAIESRNRSFSAQYCANRSTITVKAKACPKVPSDQGLILTKGSLQSRYLSLDESSNLSSVLCGHIRK